MRFGTAELGAGEHNYTVVATANGLIVTRSIFVTVTSELE